MKILPLIFAFAAGAAWILSAADGAPVSDCSALHPFQVLCEDRDEDRPRLCPLNPNRTTLVTCAAIDGVECTGSRNFTVSRRCIWTNGYTFEVAMTLSAITGVLGFDRCYLGYTTLGFIKFMTCGGFLVWALLDIALIATQVLGPADGSDYVFSSSIPRLQRLLPTNYSSFQT